MKQKLNKDWHAQNQMPAHPTVAVRLHWHLEHAKHCGCRPIPAKLMALKAGLDKLEVDKTRRTGGLSE